MVSKPAPSNFSESTLILQWENLIHNVRFFKSFLKEETKLMLMVKASAYGHYADKIALKLEESQLVHYFGVATLNEGISLRKAGVSIPIMIQNPNPLYWNKLVEHCLEPVIFDFQNLQSFQNFLVENTSLSESQYPIHLKLNTGMNRLGFDKEDINALQNILSQPKRWKIKTVLSHLSAASNKKEEAFTNQQIDLFKTLKTQLEPYLEKSTIFHILNTSGIFNFSSAQLDMVRLGIGLYGASQNKKLQKNLKPVATFKTKIATVRTVEKGDTVGYERKGKVESPRYVGVISLGYADGFPRKLGNGNWQVEINGKLYKTIGNICMDLSMIDLGEDNLPIGTEVIIFGEKKSIVDYAESLELITYEALTGIGHRVQRKLV